MRQAEAPAITVEYTAAARPKQAFPLEAGLRLRAARGAAERGIMVPHVCPWWGGYFIDNRLRRLLHKPEKILAAHLQPGMTAMDFGCGMGFFAIPMARLVGSRGRVVAVDLQQKMLNVLRRRAAAAGVAEQIRTHRCEPESVGVDQTVDFIRTSIW